MRSRVNSVVARAAQSGPTMDLETMRRGLTAMLEALADEASGAAQRAAAD